NNNVFAFKRSLDGEDYNVFINLTNNSVSGNFGSPVVLSIEGATNTNLPPWSVLVTKTAY
ncbi:MAG: hypothetical protein WCY90_02780, partial [Bacilli bacterium]